jgi:hypothetical protein
MLKPMIVVVAILVLPIFTHSGYAQEATLSGTVTDSTGGVLPGVVIRAVHEASGNTFEVVTDERGAYRLPVRIGAYRVTAELSSFTTVTRTGLELLVGQQAVVNLQMAPSALAESVTVTGEAPLIDLTSSQLGGNIDPRQTQELPLNGRNFLDLTMLAPGSRMNSMETGGMPVTTGLGSFQLNVDGQQVTNNCCGGANRQPSFSRDAIAEFQFISNRFDAVQGRSSGVQVNVVTKSGTNTPAGTLSGYFRNDRFNAPDFVVDRVLPYANQQISTTFGGPIRQDRAHYFLSYEFEREPSTITHNSPWPSFNIDLENNRKQNKVAMREDVQFSSQTRLSLYGNLWRDRTPIAADLVGGASIHPSASVKFDKDSEALQATLTQVLSNRMVNEVKVGWAANRWLIEPNLTWKSTTGLGAARNPISSYPPRINFQGYNIGPAQNYPQHIGQDVYTVRDDLTFSLNKGGRHDIRTGGEYLKYLMWHDWCNFLNGQLFADRALPPANIEALFPVWNDASTWNIAPLSPISRLYQASLGSCIAHSPRDIFGTWLQDDWAMTSRLTLNLGVRYDFETGTWANEVAVPPFLEAGRPNDANNIVPRLGLAYSLNDRTVIRGGAGKYFAWVVNQTAHPVRFAAIQRVPSVLNDGRADFAVNPWNGPLPSFEAIEQTFCNVNPAPGCVRRAVGQTLVPPNAEYPFSYQGSVGVQRQVADTMAVTVDYSFTGVRRDRISGYNINLTYNPATGRNYPFTDISRRPYPEWNQVLMDIFEGRSNYQGLETSFTKRMSNRWQASGTYTFSAYWNGTPAPWSGVMNPIPFELAEPFREQYSLAPSAAGSDQRHRAVFNGIWQAGYGFQLSGLYFFGSGQRFLTTYGGDTLNTGTVTWETGSPRIRPDGSIVPREGLVGEPIHRVDLRLLRRFPLVGRAGIDGIFEVFNLFNHANYGAYTTAESNAQYGRASFNGNVAYQPRMLQLGFRATF